MRNVFLSVALILVVIGCKGGGAVSLKYAPKVGEKYSYLLSTSAMGQSSEMGLTMTCESEKDGKYTVITTYDSMKINGKDAAAAIMDPLKKMKMITVNDSTGKTLETKVEGGPPGSPAPQSNSSMSYPTKDIKVGETWEGKTKSGGADVTAKYKLAKVEKVGGKDAAYVDMEMTGLPDGASLDGPATNIIDLESGMPISMSMKMKMKSPDGKDAIITVEMKRI